jgi:adenylate kinase
MKPINIIMMGTQGSGKGTQATKLAEHFGVPTISTGEILREEIQKGTELGRLAASYMNKGMLVPDDLINSIVRKKLQRDEYRDGVILDGYPRNIVQAEALDGFFVPNYVILLEISDKEAIRRVTGRRACPKCGEDYHLEYKAPKNNEVCDKCGGKLEVRDDSTPEAVKTRLEVFRLQTEPLMDFYGKKGVLIQVNGERTVPEVFEETVNKIKKHDLH